MTRVSTSGNFGVMTSNLMRAQVLQNLAGEQVSSQKNATDLKGYAKNAEVLTAMKTAQAKVTGFLDQTSLVANRLDVQDIGIGQVADATQDARDAVANAVAAGSAETLMQQLTGAFGDVVQGLNSRFNGRYVFAGAKSDVQPTTATSMTDLTAGPPSGTAVSIPTLFQNDQYISSNRIDDTTSVDTGQLADQLGTGVYGVFQQVQAYVDVNGPFTGKLTQVQSDFLKSLLPTFDSVKTGLITAQAQNGLNQKRFETARTDLSNQADTLTTMVGGITDVDMAEAITRLESAKLAVQASAQVFASLQNSSLLNVLK
ncbi:flagellin [Caulobacter sp. Root1455]|uniref:flagellin n=1 Tax=unclassified Caulobacter TaxID=2648921 RepID=UPI0006F47EA7|nr:MULTISPECIES: flagellin [unclassified Caulobacter]KQY28879.1 flagellin [Caulobacter sp. Root487D2Y]KQY99035.1 flagellin [Caulobacter sp. Root1455]